MKIYNTYTGLLEDFVSKQEKKVNIYICGPTVYNYIHIGNARPVVFFDTVRRYFESVGYKVTFASNFTDIDDKIIIKAKEEGKPELEVSQFYIDAFLNDLKGLNCKTDYIQPKVTNYIPQIISFIEELIEKGFAYESDGDVFFRVSKLKDYGALSNRNVDDLISGSRIEINSAKESPVDFTLWKKTTEGLNYDSPFSKGRPGWHTECVVMIDDIFGEEIDIHGGGTDLKFPHHENEIAQSKACHNHRVARYWMHNGRLDLKGAKMSKSLGNGVLVKDLENKMPLRYFLLSTHYRSPLIYSEDSYAMYVKEWDKLENTYKQLFFKLDIEDAFNDTDVLEESLKDQITKFKDAMEADFNTANAITSLQAVLKLANQNIRKPNNNSMLNEIYKTLEYMVSILGFKIDVKRIDSESRKTYIKWQDARKNKNFDLADELRAKLIEKGVL